MQRQQSGGRTRAVVFLLGSLVLAALAAGIVFSVVKKSQERIEEASKPQQTVDVVIAVRDLYMGLPITPDDVVVRSVEPEMIPREQTFSTLSDVLGRTPRERILTNEVIREERLARPDAGIGLNAIVTPGKRAMTISTDTETALAGLLQAGNYIDIIVTIAPEDVAEVGAKWVTETILQGVKILAVGSTLGGGEQAVAVDEKGKKKKATADPNKRTLKPSITVELTPEEAEKMALSQNRGKIDVVLRSDIDILQIDSNGPVTVDEALIGKPARDLPNPNILPRRNEKPGIVAPPPTTIEVYNGNNGGDVTLDPNGGTVDTNQKGRKKSK